MERKKQPKTVIFLGKIVQEILGTLPSGVGDRVTGQGKQRIEDFRPLQRVAMKS